MIKIKEGLTFRFRQDVKLCVLRGNRWRTSLQERLDEGTFNLKDSKISGY